MIKQESLTNEFGQVVNVGDTVISIALGYGHAFKLRGGTYLGIRDSDKAAVVEYTIIDRDWDGKQWKVNGVKTKLSYLPNRRVFPSTLPPGGFEPKHYWG